MTATNAMDHNDDFLFANDCEALTRGVVKAATFRYWASVNQGPPSFVLGRRRVWRRSDVLAWMARQEATTRRGESVQ